jgi:hypothetical protein
VNPIPNRKNAILDLTYLQLKTRIELFIQTDQSICRKLINSVMKNLTHLSGIHL